MCVCVYSHTMDGREEAGTQVMVQVLVLAHLEHFIPLLHRHLVLNALSCLLLVADLLPTKLNTQHSSVKTLSQDQEMTDC